MVALANTKGLTPESLAGLLRKPDVPQTAPDGSFAQDDSSAGIVGLDRLEGSVEGIGGRGIDRGIDRGGIGAQSEVKRSLPFPTGNLDSGEAETVYRTNHVRRSKPGMEKGGNVADSQNEGMNVYSDRSNSPSRSLHLSPDIQRQLGFSQYPADCEGGLIREENSEGIRSVGGGASKHQPAMVEGGDELPTPDVRKRPLTEGALSNEGTGVEREGGSQLLGDDGMFGVDEGGIPHKLCVPVHKELTEVKETGTDVATLKSGGTWDLTQEENRVEYRGLDHSEHRNREGKMLASEQLKWPVHLTDETEMTKILTQMHI